MKKIFSLLGLCCLMLVAAQSGKVRVKTAAIGFYNVENLFDTIPSADYIDGTLSPKNPAFHRSVPLDSVKFLEVTEEYKGPWSNDKLIGKKVIRYQGSADEFTPKSGKNYTTKIYKKKLENAAKVISELGVQYTNTAPVVVGLLEIENRQVLEDLVKEPALAKYNYGIAHYNSFDYRGVDVALIYQKGRFVPTSTEKKELVIFNKEGKREYTRDILVVNGLLDGEKFAFFVNHWPSRRGGEAVSLPKRNAAAKLLKELMDETRAKYPDTKLVAMGDYNDDPVSPSFKNYLKAVGDPKQLSEDYPYYNLMYSLYKRGVASLAYRDAPNLFDQMIVSKNLYHVPVRNDYSIYKTEIYNPGYLINKEGNYRGYPFRSWVGDKFTGGYSDHFPAVVILKRALEN